jgi:glycosyltransferase involved in cell wall biosynthesis
MVKSLFELAIVFIVNFTYNKPVLLKEIQELKLVFRNWQWIVVNDGSTDDIQPILKRITQTDSVRVLSYTPNRGKMLCS